MYKITDLMFSLNISPLSRHSNPLQNNGIVYVFAFILTCDSRIYIKHDKKKTLMIELLKGIKCLYNKEISREPVNLFLAYSSSQGCCNT